jgi:hypothetical protein
MRNLEMKRCTAAAVVSLESSDIGRNGFLRKRLACGPRDDFRRRALRIL